MNAHDLCVLELFFSPLLFFFGRLLSLIREPENRKLF